MKRKRRFWAAPDSLRCDADRKPLADGSGARCMKRRKAGSVFCAQHDTLKNGGTVTTLVVEVPDVL